MELITNQPHGARKRGADVWWPTVRNLLGSFLSPQRNKRTDGYSAFKAETRIRLINEVLGEIKSRAGNDFPITLSLSGYERVPGGRSIDDTQRLVTDFAAAGVDCFRVSGGISDSLVTMMVGRSEYGDAHNIAQAEAIKAVRSSGCVV
ncbi:MAG: hypothetical protein MI746_05410 [Pseudomonadales bacterium]|nr:hypothetical protein [Pseudomonadales bacterium]